MKPTIKSHDLTVYCGDALTVLGEMEDGCVQCVVASPPYDNLRTYGQPDKAEWDFEGIAKELYRVLCDGGICCWNVGDSVNDGSETLTSFKQALFFKEQIGFRVHDTMIWRKLNFANPESARYHQLFEYVFILSKGKPRCFNPIKDKPNATAGRIGCLGENTYAQRDGSRSTRQTYVTTEFGMRGNVWDGPTRGQEEFCEKLPHPAMMPKWLVRDLILSWSNPGDTILDPFAGSGTTGVQAMERGRNAILIERNEDYMSVINEQTIVTSGFQFGG